MLFKFTYCISFPNIGLHSASVDALYLYFCELAVQNRSSEWQPELFSNRRIEALYICSGWMVRDNRILTKKNSLRMFVSKDHYLKGPWLYCFVYPSVALKVRSCFLVLLFGILSALYPSPIPRRNLIQFCPNPPPSVSFSTICQVVVTLVREGGGGKGGSNLSVMSYLKQLHSMALEFRLVCHEPRDYCRCCMIGYFYV